MFHSSTTLRRRATGIVGGLAVMGAAGAGLSSAADASSSGSTLAAIKYCESGGNYRAQNATTTASGAYQFLDTTWRGLSAGKGYAKAKYAPKAVQDAAAREMYNEAGTSPWAASAHCWAR